MSRKVAREAPALARAARTKRSRPSSREPAAKPVGSGTADALLAYSQKRDFGKTAEPKGRVQGSAGNRFCVQKHDATRLHYDLRLELDGVLKSWAVTRGPSLVPGEKRLSVHTEDHPMEYLTFEGVIPKGEYGGGTMIVWDQGRWRPEGDPRKAYAKGHLDFSLEGQRLKGRWHLVRMRPARTRRRSSGCSSRATTSSPARLPSARSPTKKPPRSRRRYCGWRIGIAHTV